MHAYLLIDVERARADERRQLTRRLAALQIHLEEAILRMQETETVTLVGHNPDISLLAAWLIGSKKAQIELAKAGAAFIRSETGPSKGAGELLWMVTSAWCQG